MSGAASAPTLLVGKAIGPVRIGMTRDEVGGLGLEVRPHPSGHMGNNLRLVGPYSVVFDGDRVASIAFTLTGSRTGITIAGRQIPESASVEDVAKALGNCSEPDLREGGTIIKCGDGTLIKTGAGTPPVLEIQVMAPGLLQLL